MKRRLSDMAVYPARQAVSSATGVSRPSLVWDKDIEKSAQAWADQLAASGQFEHSGGPNGENLFKMSPFSAGTVIIASQSWLNEASNYHGEPIDGNFASYGHYTQVREEYFTMADVTC